MYQMNRLFPFLILCLVLTSCGTGGNPQYQTSAAPLRKADMNEHTYSLREDVIPAHDFIVSQILEAATNVKGVSRAAAYSNTNFDVVVGVEGTGEDLQMKVYDAVKKIVPSYQVTIIPYQQMGVNTQGNMTPPIYNPLEIDLKQEIRSRLNNK